MHAIKLFLSILFFAIGVQIQGQNLLINDGGGQPDPSAALEIRSSERGLLIPRMDASERLLIASPVEGLMVYQTDGTPGFYFYNGTQWDTLAGSQVVTNIQNINNVSNVSNSNIAVVRDLKGSSVDGGTFNAGAWRTRDLNDLSGDQSFISLSGDTIVLDTGTYVFTIAAPARLVDQHQCRLFNTSDNSVEAVGTAVNANAASSTSDLSTVVSVSGGQKKFLIQHRCQSTVASDGFGQSASWGNNVYTQVQIEKL